jgi:hypothetical protein
MDLKILEIDDQKIAEVISDQVVIRNERDALDLMADAGYYSARGIILREENLEAEFFDLSSGMAGEILGKFSAYRVKLAIIGAFDKFDSKSLKAFMAESNRGNLIFFVPDLEIAFARVSGKVK